MQQGAAPQLWEEVAVTLQKRPAAAKPEHPIRMQVVVQLPAVQGAAPAVHCSLGGRIRRVQRPAFAPAAHRVAGQNLQSSLAERRPVASQARAHPSSASIAPVIGDSSSQPASPSQVREASERCADASEAGGQRSAATAVRDMCNMFA